jgi:thioredoxin reductase
MNKQDSYDVLVIGGGAAGLSAALALSRARRRVLVVDDGHPRNASAEHVHNYLSRDGSSPAELLRIGRAEVRSYGGEIIANRAIRATATGRTFDVLLASDTVLTTRRILLATGLTDVLPAFPGLQQRWGRDVLHCPYCHGWEVRDQRIGVLATSPFSVHQARLFSQWSNHVILLLHKATAPSGIEQQELAVRGVTVVEGEVDSVLVEDDRLTGVRFCDGATLPLQALVVAPQFIAHSEVAESLGLRVTEHPLGRYYAADSTGMTAVPGLWAAGNVSELSAQLVTAAAAGLSSGANLNADLLDEDVATALAQLPRVG